MSWARLGGTDWVDRGRLVTHMDSYLMTAEEDGIQKKWAVCGAGDGSSRSMVTAVNEWKIVTCQRCRKKAGIAYGSREELKADNKIYREKISQLKKENWSLREEIKKLKAEKGG